MLEAIAKYTLEWDMFPSLKNWDSFAYHAVLGYQALDKDNLTSFGTMGHGHPFWHPEMVCISCQSMVCQPCLISEYIYI